MDLVLQYPARFVSADAPSEAKPHVPWSSGGILYPLCNKINRTVEVWCDWVEELNSISGRSLHVRTLLRWALWVAVLFRRQGVRRRILWTRVCRLLYDSCTLSFLGIKSSFSLIMEYCKKFLWVACSISSTCWRCRQLEVPCQLTNCSCYCETKNVFHCGPVFIFKLVWSVGVSWKQEVYSVYKVKQLSDCCSVVLTKFGYPCTFSPVCLCVNRLLDALCLSCWTDAAACQSLPCFYNLQRL